MHTTPVGSEKFLFQDLLHFNLKIQNYSHLMNVENVTQLAVYDDIHFFLMIKYGSVLTYNAER